MAEDMLMHRIKAHRSAPDIYDPPTFEDMADRIEELEAKLEKAVEALAAWKHYDESDEQDHVSLMLNYADAIEKTRTTIAELKGEK